MEASFAEKSLLPVFYNSCFRIERSLNCANHKQRDTTTYTFCWGREKEYLFQTSITFHDKRVKKKDHLTSLKCREVRARIFLIRNIDKNNCTRFKLCRKTRKPTKFKLKSLVKSKSGNEKFLSSPDNHNISWRTKLNPRLCKCLFSQSPLRCQTKTKDKLTAKSGYPPFNKLSIVLVSF